MNIPEMFLKKDASEIDKEIYETYLKIMKDLQDNRPTELQLFTQYGFEIPRERWEELGFGELLNAP